ncbi:DUF6483 family protein [Clostridium pasteurianum]
MDIHNEIQGAGRFMNDDYILRMIESAVKNAGKLIFNKENDDIDTISIEAMDEKDILKIVLNRLVMECKYDEAENILFEQMEKTPSRDIFNIGIEFYNKLLVKSDEELLKGNFSKEEILQGLNDLKNMIVENKTV